MKYIIISLITFLALAPHSYAAESGDKKANSELTKLAASQLNHDFRIVFKLEKNADICGARGDAYVGQVEMNEHARSYNEKDGAHVEDRWVKIDKTYSIFVDELGKPDVRLFDADNCME